MIGENASQRPWGYSEVLTDEPDHKIQRITLSPGGRLSLQRHQKRQEHWFVLKGEALAFLGNQMVKLMPGSSLDIPVRTIHRLENRGTESFVLIEIQRGEYFGEDDIERLEDDYGRI